MPVPSPHNGKFDTAAWTSGVGSPLRQLYRRGKMRHQGYSNSNPFSTGEALSKHVRTYFNNTLVHFISLLSSQRAFGKQSGLMQLSSANAGSGQVLLAPRWPGAGRLWGMGWGEPGFQFWAWREGGTHGWKDPPPKAASLPRQDRSWVIFTSCASLYRLRGHKLWQPPAETGL